VGEVVHAVNALEEPPMVHRPVGPIKVRVLQHDERHHTEGKVAPTALAHRVIDAEDARLAPEAKSRTDE
jgi:hypothetical protein